MPALDKPMASRALSAHLVESASSTCGRAAVEVSLWEPKGFTFQEYPYFCAAHADFRRELIPESITTNTEAARDPAAARRSKGLRMFTRGGQDWRCDVAFLVVKSVSRELARQSGGCILRPESKAHQRPERNGGDRTDKI